MTDDELTVLAGALQAYQDAWRSYVAAGAIMAAAESAVLALDRQLAPKRRPAGRLITRATLEHYR